MSCSTPFGAQDQGRRAFLEDHRRVQLHFTPTYSSWLNQVELWFANIQRDVIARGVFTSVADLGKRLRTYIRAYSKSTKRSAGPTRTRRLNQEHLSPGILFGFARP